MECKGVLWYLARSRLDLPPLSISARLMPQLSCLAEEAGPGLGDGKFFCHGVSNSVFCEVPSWKNKRFLRYLVKKPHNAVN